ncbi:hypothetical protein DPMN_071979 [Dreissena polymorpha]|uniref:Uncharacterized protein n=1 Tax=Dreissena polymorpha TaxID=45954 RepID=A0A9D3Z7Y9_DREPO|nr:hypothetical protein DPMN_071979 [Dreissena polymorpha]
MLTPRIMKLHRNIDHDWQMTPIDFQITRFIDHDSQMTPIDFQVTRSKVKVTVPKNCWNRILKAFANSLDPDETPQNVASHQDPNYNKEEEEEEDDDDFNNIADDILDLQNPLGSGHNDAAGYDRS